MATNFPTSLDSLTNPGPTDSMAVVSHSSQHINANDAIEALEAKVGVDGSAVTTSLDYLVTHVPISTAVTGLGTGVATFLATPSSANLAAAITDETGTGALVFAGGNIGAATGTSLALAGTLNVVGESQFGAHVYILQNQRIQGLTAFPGSVAALNLNPLGGGVSVNGATIGSNALAVTGTAAISGNMSVGDLSLTTVSPGINTPIHNLSRDIFSTDWPIDLSSIYDSNDVEHYLIFNGRLTGGTKASPTFTSGYGGAFINEGGGLTPFIKIGTIPSGAGGSRTTVLAITSGGVSIGGATIGSNALAVTGTAAISGNVGIGTAPDSNALKISGNLEVTGGYIYANTAGNSFYSTGLINARGGIGNDNGTRLFINGGTAAETLFTSHILFTDNTYDIGASGATRPRNYYGAGNIRAGTFVSAETDFRFAGVSYFSLGKLDLGTGAFGGGYNLDWNSSSPRHDQTAALAGYGYKSDGSLNLYAQGSQAAGTSVSPRLMITGSTGEVSVASSFVATTTIKPGTYTVAGLPAVVAGAIVYASNGRKAGEGGGAGTGVLAFGDATNWRAVDTGATVAA